MDFLWTCLCPHRGFSFGQFFLKFSTSSPISKSLLLLIWLHKLWCVCVCVCVCVWVCVLCWVYNFYLCLINKFIISTRLTRRGLKYIFQGPSKSISVNRSNLVVCTTANLKWWKFFFFKLHVKYGVWIL